MNHPFASRRIPTPGFALALVLICLTVVTLSLTAMISRVSQGRRQVIQRQRLVQAQWLAESAIDRAVAQWQRDPAYRGETWQLASEVIGNRGSAQAAVEVEPNSAGTSATIRVTVVYPQQSNVAVRCTKQVSIRMTNASEESAGGGGRESEEPPLAPP